MHVLYCDGITANKLNYVHGKHNGGPKIRDSGQIKGQFHQIFLTMNPYQNKFCTVLILEEVSWIHTFIQWSHGCGLI